MMVTDEIAKEVAKMIGLDGYDPDSYSSPDRASFTKEDRWKTYEKLTGNCGDEYLRK